MRGDEDARAKAAQRVGTVLGGRYTLKRLLGLGDVSAVFEASRREGSLVAVKLLDMALPDDDALRDEAFREVRQTGSLGHPCAVVVEDSGVGANGQPFLVMELLEGETLGERWRREGDRLSVEEVLRIGEQLLDVLAIAHEQGVVHGDIKPENLYLTLRGSLKVLDFGMASLRRHAAEASSEATSRAIGSPEYLPPEQARARLEAVGEHSDLWAAGATMFAMLTGETVHGGDSPSEQLGLAMTSRARPIQSLRPDLPNEVADLVDTALEYNAVDRWPKAVDMLYALRHAYEVTQGARLSNPHASLVSASKHPPPSELATDDRVAQRDGSTPNETGSGVRRSARARTVVALCFMALLTAVAVLVATRS